MSYKFNLNTMCVPQSVLQYEIGDEFFQGKDYSPVQKGRLDADVTVSKKPDAFDVEIRLEGHVVVACDRCSDDMEVAIHSDNVVAVKWGDSTRDNDDTVYVDEVSGELDLEPLLYDYIILSVPVRCVHPEGQCNADMLARLEQYLVKTETEE